MINMHHWGIWQWVVVLYLAADWGITCTSPATRHKLEAKDARTLAHPFITRAAVFVGAGLNSLILLSIMIIGGFFQ